MRYQDISHDRIAEYRIKQNESVVFFMLNRTGTITLDLSEPGATAHVFAFYTGRTDSKQSLELNQKHSAPDTTSSALIKSVLNDKAAFTYDGAIIIEKDAHRSDASQESRSLLLSPAARAHARPALEILAHDVKCHHAATAGPLSEESLFFAQSRGLSEKQAHALLVQGFFHEALETMERLGIETDDLRERLATHIA